MNFELEAFARKRIGEMLGQCTSAQKKCFKLMYAHGQRDITLEDAVRLMDTGKLGWAMSQLQLTIAKDEDVQAFEGLTDE
jgi:hypothetical protein